jgi:hypothetical protein
MLDVVEVIVRCGHADRCKLVYKSLLEVLPLIFNQLISSVDDLPEAKFGLLAVDLGKLLHFELVFGHEVLLSLGKVSEVLGRCTCKDLATGHCGVFLNYSASRDDSERFYFGPTLDGRAHADKGVVLEDAGVKAHVGTYVDVLTDLDSVSLSSLRACDPCAVLDRRIFTDRNGSCVTPYNDAMPERSAFAKLNIADYCCVRRDPVSIQ